MIAINDVVGGGGGGLWVFWDARSGHFVLKFLRDLDIQKYIMGFGISHN